MFFIIWYQCTEGCSWREDGPPQKLVGPFPSYEEARTYARGRITPGCDFEVLPLSPPE
jgi:hypothetical protein